MIIIVCFCCFLGGFKHQNMGRDDDIIAKHWYMIVYWWFVRGLYSPMCYIYISEYHHPWLGTPVLQKRSTKVRHSVLNTAHLYRCSWCLTRGLTTCWFSNMTILMMNHSVIHRWCIRIITCLPIIYQTMSLVDPADST